MKKNRQAEIIKIINTYEVETQEMLQALLKERGYDVTQATISRDINELNIEKGVSENGVICYTRSSRVRTVRGCCGNRLCHEHCGGKMPLRTCQCGLCRT